MHYTMAFVDGFYLVLFPKPVLYLIWISSVMPRQMLFPLDSYYKELTYFQD